MIFLNKYSKLCALALSTGMLLAACGGGNDTSQLKPHPAPPAAAPANADTVAYSGKRADYLITKISNGYLVTDTIGNSGSNTLSGVKSIQFSDFRVNLEIGDKANAINLNDLNSLIDLYIAFFNRIPDADGLSYWIDQYQAGISLDQIAQSFYSAALQYSAQTGYSSAMSNEDFVRLIYKNVLGRSGTTAPPNADVQYWVGQLSSGASKGSMIRTMLNAARNFAGDATWGWVSRLLDNKLAVGSFFSIQQGLNFNSPEESITKTMAISAAVTATSTSYAVNLIGVTDLSFNQTMPGTPDNLANICTPQIEKSWVRAHLDDVYLWYKNIFNVSSSAYATPQDYFDALLVKSRDHFSFSSDRSAIDGYFESGLDVGYGYSLLREGSRLRVLYVQPGSPADLAQIVRGATIASIDYTSLAQPANDTQFAALYPSKIETHSFEIVDAGASGSRVVQMTAANVTKAPVLQSTVLNVEGKKVGYLVFNDHIATAEAPLISAIRQFQQSGISDLVLDVRYNGGGYLYIADELASMIGGVKVNNQMFEQLQYNDKHPEKIYGFVFYDSSTQNETLPKLNLPRVFILTSNRTCSASESIINGLSPFMQVILIGDQTCGKPYGFRQTNNCSTAYFAIQFAGINAAGQGDYTNGFAPTCSVSDDLEHALGDTAEARLAAALSYAHTGSCPAVAKTAPPPSSRLPAERDPYPWRNIRLLN